MRKTMTLSIILAAAIGCSALAFAQGGPGFGGHGHHGFHGGGLALRGVTLTDTQKASIKQIKQSEFSSLKSQFQAVRQQRQAFEALSPSSSGYQAAAASLAQAEGQLVTARITADAAANAQIYTSVLTGAQQNQVATNKANFQARQAEWQQFKASHPAQSTSSSAQ
jgi:Spy/CpxP family protein refolding chaperone